MNRRIALEMTDRKENVRILLPMDFTEGSWEALDYGVQLVREVGGSLTVLNVVDDSKHGSFEGPPNWDEIHARQSCERELCFSFIKQKYGGQIPLSFAVETGSAGEVISTFANENDFDAIVIAAHLHHWWQIFHRHTVKRVLEGSGRCSVHILMPVPKHRRHPPVEVVNPR